MTNEEIIEAIIALYPELHEVRNELGTIPPHPSYGSLRHTLVNLWNILSYYEENKKNAASTKVE